MKKTLAVLLLLAVLFPVFGSCGNGSGGVVNVYSKAHTIDESVIYDFERLTGIRVNHQLYSSNEQLYMVLSRKNANYDVIFPSDHMAEKLISEDMLSEINFKNVPDISKIDSRYLNMYFDPEQKYTVPYSSGIIGLIYNKKLTEEPVTSWSALFDTRYSGKILQFDTCRDAAASALLYLGYPVNTTDISELEEAYNILVEQKEILDSYFIPRSSVKLKNGKAVIAACSGRDAVKILKENSNLRFCIPDEGTVFSVDTMCIPKNTENKKNAELFINFMCGTEAALKNTESASFATVSAEAFEKLDDSIKKNRFLFPDEEVIAHSQRYESLPDEISELYRKYWSMLRT